MPVKHIKKAVGKVTQAMDMRLVGIAVVIIAVIVVALWLSQSATAPTTVPTPTPVVSTPTPVPTVVVSTPTPVAETPTPNVYTPVEVGGQVTEKPHCTDGTAEGECNPISFTYCRQAPVGLETNCAKCGCPSGMTCDTSVNACKS